MANWRALCEELVEALEIQLDELRFDNRLCNRARAALAQPEPEVMPSDEEIMGLMPQQMHEDLATAARAMAEQAGADSTRVKGAMRIILNRHVVDLAHAAIAADRARWGRPAPAPAGEVGELVDELRMMASQAAEACQFTDAENLSRAAELLERHAVTEESSATAPAPAGEVGELVLWLRSLEDASVWFETGSPEARRLARAADLLEQRQAAPVPVVSDVYFEFVVSGPDDCTQAGGIAPTYAQALSEGQHYLAQYQQDGPHTLEVRRVEVLPPGAFPVPDDAPVPLLPEDAQIIEPTERTILVPVPVPVAVSERPWEREGWCDSEGRCWIHCPGQSWDTWVLTVPQNAIDGAHCLPATALPLPGGEVG